MVENTRARVRRGDRSDGRAGRRVVDKVAVMACYQRCHLEVIQEEHTSTNTILVEVWLTVLKGIANMAKQAKTLQMIDQAYKILAAVHPMTVRQVYYQLVSRQVIKNSRSTYQAVSNALVDARLDGVIPWEWVEDRTRRP